MLIHCVAKFVEILVFDQRSWFLHLLVQIYGCNDFQKRYQVTEQAEDWADEQFGGDDFQDVIWQSAWLEIAKGSNEFKNSN